MTKIPIFPRLLAGTKDGVRAFWLFGHWAIGAYLRFEIWLLEFIQPDLTND
jgi:hypothetical protein